LQRLHVARQCGAQIADSILRVAFEFSLHLAGLVAAGQPHQGAKQHQHQTDQCQPQGQPVSTPGQQVVQGAVPALQPALPVQTPGRERVRHG